MIGGKRDDEETTYKRDNFQSRLVKSVLYCFALAIDDVVSILTSSLVTVPFKTVFANMVNNPTKYASFWITVMSLVKEEGFLSLWKGFVAHLLAKLIPVLLISLTSNFIINLIFGLPDRRKHAEDVDD